MSVDGLRGARALHLTPNAVAEERHLLAQPLLQLVGDGLQRELLVSLPIGAAEMGTEHHGPADEEAALS